MTMEGVMVNIKPFKLSHHLIDGTNLIKHISVSSHEHELIVLAPNVPVAAFVASFGLCLVQGVGFVCRLRRLDGRRFGFLGS